MIQIFFKATHKIVEIIVFSQIKKHPKYSSKIKIKIFKIHTKKCMLK